MEHKVSFKNKTGSDTVVIHSDTKRNNSWGLSFAIIVLYSTYSINTQADQSWFWISSTWNWEENKSLIEHRWLETAR